ncbi:hypothetical protein ABND25_20210 [Paenibacillus larvae]
MTTKGRNLQAKAQTGVELKYTRVGIGDGQLAGQSIMTLNKLINEKKSLPITKLNIQTIKSKFVCKFPQLDCAT